MLARADRIDGLVNNAGIGGGPVEDVPVDWVKSLFETIQAVLPGMRAQRSGAIVNVRRNP